MILFLVYVKLLEELKRFKGFIMGWIDFSEHWNKFVKYVDLDVQTLINSEKYKKACNKYIKDKDLDIDIVEVLEKDRKLKLAQMSD